MAKEIIPEEVLDKVVGGYMNFNYYTKILTYTHEETGEVTTYKILDFQNAWSLSNTLHGQNIHEDTIIAQLKSNKYIA